VTEAHAAARREEVDRLRGLISFCNMGFRLISDF